MPAIAFFQYLFSYVIDRFPPQEKERECRVEDKNKLWVVVIERLTSTCDKTNYINLRLGSKCQAAIAASLPKKKYCKIMMHRNSPLSWFELSVCKKSHYSTPYCCSNAKVNENKNEGKSINNAQTHTELENLATSQMEIKFIKFYNGILQLWRVRSLTHSQSWNSFKRNRPKNIETSLLLYIVYIQNSTAVVVIAKCVFISSRIVVIK